MPFGNRKFILEDLFSSVFSQFKNYHPFGNVKFINSDIFQSLKYRILMGKKSFQILLAFTPNTLGCSGLSRAYLFELIARLKS